MKLPDPVKLQMKAHQDDKDRAVQRVRSLEDEIRQLDSAETGVDGVEHDCWMGCELAFFQNRNRCSYSTDQSPPSRKCLLS